MIKFQKFKKKSHKVKKRRSIVKNRFLRIFVLLLILVLSVFSFLTFFEKFQIREIKISGNEKVSTDELEDIVFKKINRKILFLNSKSIFLTNKKEVVKDVLEKNPKIEEVKIEKAFPSGLILEVKERKHFAVFCGQKCFFLDKNGIIFETHEDSLEKELIIRFFDSSLLAKGEELGREVIKKDIVDLILNIKKNLKENFQIDIKEAILNESNRLDVKTAENWQIYFNLEPDINLQIVKLNLLLKEEILPENRKNLEYVDLRFTRAYYK